MPRILFIFLAIFTLTLTFSLPFVPNAQGIEKNYSKAKSLIREGKHEEAGALLYKLSQDGHAASQYELGRMFDSGLLNGWDREHGAIKIAYQHNPILSPKLYWYLQSAKQGYGDAQSAIAHKYFTKGEYGEAFDWFNKAVVNDNTSSGAFLMSLSILGSMYEDGQGVAKDIPTAYAFFTLAKEAGDTIMAPERIVELEQKMDYDDRVKAQDFMSDLLRRREEARATN